MNGVVAVFDVVMPWKCRCMSMLGYRAVAAVNSAQGGNDVTATLQALQCRQLPGL